MPGGSYGDRRKMGSLEKLDRKPSPLSAGELVEKSLP